MFEIKTFSSQNKELHKIAIAIRIKVFVEEQGVDFNLEEDEYEGVCTHYLVMKDDEAIATARSRETDQGIKLERIALLNKCRGQNIGSYLLNFLIETHKTLGKTIYLHAQTVATRFYEKHGFEKNDQPFMEDGIEHVKMNYQPAT